MRSLDTAWIRALAGGGVLACVAAIALVGWLHINQAGKAQPRPRAAVPAAQAAMWREWRSFPGYRDVVPVLMYHSIGGRPSYLTTSRALFAEQMRALKAGGFHTLTIQQYAAYVHGDRRGLPERPIMITFDDGRQDAYLAANGILRGYGFHATELAVPGWVVHNPGLSVSWAELEQMHRGNTWDVEPHFGYGPEKVTVSNTGMTGRGSPTCSTSRRCPAGLATLAIPVSCRPSPSSRRRSPATNCMASSSSVIICPASSRSPPPSPAPTTARTARTTG